MINTIVRGVPTTCPDAGYPFKYLVRTFYHTKREMYVTAVWRLLEAEHDFDWAKNHPEHHHYIKDDDKNQKILTDDCSLYLWDHICTHRKRASNRSLGELHLRVCKEIIDGEYWDGEFAFP